MSKPSIQSILVVDDSEDDRFLARLTLEDFKFCSNIYECSNGEQAIHFLSAFNKQKEKLGENFPPEYILLDINMPIMGGLEFLKEFQGLLESEPRLKSIKIAMYSTSNLNSDVQEAKTYPFVCDYIVKPIDEDVLNRLIENKP